MTPELTPCRGCGFPTARTFCKDCGPEDRTPTAPTPPPFSRLPAVEPEPAGLPFCTSCGALAGLATWHDVTKCSECWRGAE